MKYEKLLAYKLFKHIAIETIRDCEQYLKATNDFLTFENIDYLLITEDINNSVSDYNIIRYARFDGQSPGTGPGGSCQGDQAAGCVADLRRRS